MSDVMKAIERLESSDQEYWFAIDKLPDAAKDARLLAAFVRSILPTPEVAEAMEHVRTHRGFSALSAIGTLADYANKVLTALESHDHTL